jgi:hypothetical protein
VLLWIISFPRRQWAPPWRRRNPAVAVYAHQAVLLL